MSHPFPRLDRRCISVGTLSAGDDTKAFWAAKSPQERLQALELNRQIFFAYDPTTARLQRVLEVVERPWR